MTTVNHICTLDTVGHTNDLAATFDFAMTDFMAADANQSRFFSSIASFTGLLQQYPNDPHSCALAMQEMLTNYLRRFLPDIDVKVAANAINPNGAKYTLTATIIFPYEANIASQKYDLSVDGSKFSGFIKVLNG